MNLKNILGQSPTFFKKNKSPVKVDRYLKIAISIWGAVIVVICLLVFLAPLKHTVTPVYHEAVEEWLAGQSLYVGTSYFYFPQFVFVFLPFHLLPVPIGDIFWRILSIALLSWGIWRIVSLIHTPQNTRLFLYASLIALTPSFDAMRNGQANVLFAALTVHAAASLAQSWWWFAILCMVGTLTIKPLGLVMILLAAVVYRSIIGRLTVGISIFLILPFFFVESSYVFSQYRQAIEHLFSFSVVTAHRFADLNGLLRTLGIGLVGSASQIVRVGAGLLTLIIWWICAKRLNEPYRAWLLLGLTTTYLMLFNPMTEVNSYVIVAPILSLYAVRFLIVEGHSTLGWGLVFMGLSIGILPEIVRRIDRNFGLWWQPLMMVILSGILIYSSLSRRFIVKSEL